MNNECRNTSDESRAAVFIPVLFMGGLIGRLFREFAVTIGVAVLVSGFIALTLTPMLSSRFLRDPAKACHGRAWKFTEKIYAAVLAFYERTLRWVLLHKPIAMGFGAGAESRRPLGLAVVGGLVFSQTLTLYVTPVFYLYMEALRRKFQRA